MKTVTLSLVAVSLLFLAADCRSADDAAAPAKKDDAAVAQAKKTAGEFFQAYEKTFASGDAKALAACWKTDGEIVDATGIRTSGREAIEKLFSEFFAKNAGSKVKIELLLAKPDGEGVIVAEILPKITPSIDKSIYQVGAVAVLVKDKSGKWLLEGVREKNPVPACHEHLKQLEWLVGDWNVNKKKAGKDVVFSVQCHWTDNKSFLICMYTAKYLDTVRHGTEVIGWDAKEKKIRSWMFDSNGGFTQGSWKNDGKRWSVEVSGIAADGEDVKSSQTLTTVDADTFTFEAKGRLKGSEKHEDTPVLEMQRVKSHLPTESDE